MKNVIFNSTPHGYVNRSSEKGFFFSTGKLLPNFFRNLWSSHTGITVLLIAMMSLFLISCDDRHQTPAEDVLSKERVPAPDFGAMSPEELMEYFKDYEFGKRGSPPVSLEITDAEGLPAVPRLKTRSSEKCDVEITVSSHSGSSTDSAKLVIYENDVPIDSFKLFHTPKFLIEIDDANEYKYKVVPLGDDSNPNLSLKVGLKYGTKWVFNVFDVLMTQPFNYTCPESTGGLCEIEWEITKIAGSATKYEVLFLPTSGPPTNFVSDIVYPGIPLNKTVNSNFAYDLYIRPVQGGPREFFQFVTSTPYLNVSIIFDLDTTNPNEEVGVFPDFDYYDCP